MPRSRCRRRVSPVLGKRIEAPTSAWEYQNSAAVLQYVMAARHQDWLRQADADLRHARQARDHGAHEWACFAAQQAAEKSIKAVILSRGAGGRVGIYGYCAARSGDDRRAGRGGVDNLCQESRAFCRNSGALMRNWGVKTRGLICRGCTSSNTPSGRQWRLARPEFAADAASVTAREQNCPVSPAGEQLGDRWYVAATKSGFQFTKRSNWSTVNARTPNIRWHSTLLWPRTRTCRAPNSSFSRPLTRSTVDRSR